MGRKVLSPVVLYLTTAAAILGWWYAAFVHPSAAVLQIPVPQVTRHPARLTAPQYLSYLSTMDRGDIQKALSGNIPLMTKLMAEWDVDAQILENHGLIGVERLSRQEFIKAQMIGRQLKKGAKEELELLRQQYCFEVVQDDNGCHFYLDKPFQKYLPQTYLSATFLLALTEPENIVAIPQGFREQTHLYPPSLTSRIPINVDRYNSEEIYQKGPEVAFVAHYSLPSTLQALRSQGIPLFTLKAIDTLPDVTSAIHRVGHVINRPLEAELLTLFMESAMVAIDNHILAMGKALTEEHGTPSVMFLNYHTQYSLPTQRTLTGRLLERLSACHKFAFISASPNASDDWMIPIEQENIVRLDPDCLIIASSNSEALQTQIKGSPSLSQLTASKEEKIYFVDGNVFDSPSQYIVLAYYDLAKVLVDATSPYAR